MVQPQEKYVPPGREMVVTPGPIVGTGRRAHAAKVSGLPTVKEHLKVKIGRVQTITEESEHLIRYVRERLAEQA